MDLSVPFLRSRPLSGIVIHRGCIKAWSPIGELLKSGNARAKVQLGHPLCAIWELKGGEFWWRSCERTGGLGIGAPCAPLVPINVWQALRPSAKIASAKDKR